jgi:hypothetical protein
MSPYLHFHIVIPVRQVNHLVLCLHIDGRKKIIHHDLPRHSDCVSGGTRAPCQG